MKRVLSLLAFFPLLAVSAGCQVPAPSKGANVNLTWTAPAAGSNWAGCTTSSPCLYAVYRAAGTTCPATTSTAWTEITTPATRPSGTTYQDTTASGLTACYNVETVQASQNSAPSNTAGPLAVPGVPLAPALGTPTAAALVKPALPNDPQMASNTAPTSLVAKVVRLR